MIELEVQFQVVVASVFLGMVFTNFYTFIDIILSKSKIIRVILELSYFLSITIFYYYIIFILNNGKLSIYMPVCLALGYYLHMKFYDKYFSCLYKYWFLKIHSIIEKKKDRCKKIWKGLMKLKINKVKSTE